MTASVNTGSQLEHPIGPTGRFVLRVPSGEITIHGTDGDVARVREVGGRVLGERFDIVTGEGSLEVVAKQRFGITIGIGSLSFGGSSPELEIDVPRGATVTVETASADVLAHGLVGPKRFRTASGDLTLDAVGGELELDAVSGDTRVEADGTLEVKSRSISGDFHLRAPKLTRFEMTTTSGDVHLDAAMAGGGPYSIKSISGDCTIVARSGLQVEAQTITGDLSSRLAHRTETRPGRKLLIVGKPVATLIFHSVSGDLEIVESRDGVATDLDTAPPSEHSVDAPAAPTPPAPPTPPMAPPVPPTAPAAATGATVPADAAEAARLGILQALERGDLDVEDAMKQLAALEEG
jgi:hypothetical protein